MSAQIWKNRLAAPPQHQWFEAFEDSGEEALDALLWRRFDLANLSTIEVDDVLSRWLLAIGREGDFARRVDSALSAWITQNWGDDASALPDTVRALWATVGRVLCASYVPARQRYFDQSAKALRDSLLGEPSFGAHLFVPRGCDAFSSCLNAVALYQTDDNLRDFWLQLAALPHGFPSRYATVALTGIRRMRVAHGGFRYDYGHALFTVARSISRLVRDGFVSEEVGADEFIFLYERANGQFPSWAQAWAAVFDAYWKPDFRRECAPSISAFLETQSRSLGWFFRRNPDLTQSRHESFTAHLSITWDAANAPRDIEMKLLQRDRDAVRAAKWLLNEQRKHALKTGNFSYLVRSLQKFAVAVRDTARNEQNLLLAQRWVVEITERDPDDPRGWSLLVNVLKLRDEMKGSFGRAWRLAWALVDRFPGDAYCRGGLAEVLKSQGRLNEAEEVYRQASEDFPHEVVVRCGLADVLKSQGRLDEAEEVYSQAVADFPRDAASRCGFAYILGALAIRNHERRDEYLRQAQEQYQIALGFARNKRDELTAMWGLGWISEKQREFESALSRYSQILNLDRHNIWAEDGIKRVQEKLVRLESQPNFPEGLAEQEELISPPMTGEVTRDAAAQLWTQYLESALELADLRYQQDNEPIPAERALARRLDVENPDVIRTNVPWSIVGYRLRMARASFFRRSARWQESLAVEKRAMEPSRLRAAARKLLKEVLSLRGTEARANAELFALDLEDEAVQADTGMEGRVQDALKAPTAELLQVAASATRVESRRNNYSLHDSELRGIVFAPVERLRSFDPAAKPLCDLEHAMASLSMVDSNERLQSAAASLEKLRSWVAPRARHVRQILVESNDRQIQSITPFEAWSHAVSQRLFKPCGISDETTESISLERVRQVDAWLKEEPNQRQVSDMEHQFARLLTPAIEEALALV